VQELFTGDTSKSGQPKQRTDQLPPAVLWSAIARAPRFYETLPWTSDGPALWNALRRQMPCPPDILTGVSNGPTVAAQKLAWCQRELCVEVNHVNCVGPRKSHERQNGTVRRQGVTNVYTCWTRNKHLESGPGRYAY
jgi:hypothetical protein